MSLDEVMVKSEEIKPVAIGYDLISCIVNQSVENSMKCFFFKSWQSAKGLMKIFLGLAIPIQFCLAFVQSIF